MGIVRLGGAFRHRNLSRRAALRLGGGGWGWEGGEGRSVSHTERRICASACVHVGEIKIGGTARSGSMSTETDRQGITVGGN